MMKHQETTTPTEPVTAEASLPPTEPIYCIRCDALLVPLDEGESQAATSPRYGLVLYTHGGYGSSHFDPCDGGSTRLELYLCDTCTTTGAPRIWHVTPGALSPDNVYVRFDRHLASHGSVADEYPESLIGKGGAGSNKTKRQP
jgi:hypothetical protein